ncbi:Unknown protein, partial [Striga hermonthica]
ETSHQIIPIPETTPSRNIEKEQDSVASASHTPESKGISVESNLQMVQSSKIMELDPLPCTPEA